MIHVCILDRLEPVDVEAYEENLRRIDTENIDDVMGMMNDCLAQKVGPPDVTRKGRAATFS